MNNPNTPWVENVSLHDIKKAQHFDPGPNSMLISIVDPDMEFPGVPFPFGEIHRFKFLDIEEDGFTNLGDGSWTDMSDFSITDIQAQKIVELLKRAFEKRMNLVVHCHAGVCRSGAVAEVAVIMGFKDTKRFRSPNLLVKKKLLKFLGFHPV